MGRNWIFSISKSHRKELQRNTTRSQLASLLGDLSSPLAYGVFSCLQRHTTYVILCLNSDNRKSWSDLCVLVCVLSELLLSGSKVILRVFWFLPLCKRWASYIRGWSARYSHHPMPMYQSKSSPAQFSLWGQSILGYFFPRAKYPSLQFSGYSLLVVCSHPLNLLQKCVDPVGLTV